MDDPSVAVILDDYLVDGVLFVLFPDFRADHIGSDSHKGGERAKVDSLGRPKTTTTQKRTEGD